MLQIIFFLEVVLNSLVGLITKYLIVVFTKTEIKTSSNILKCINYKALFSFLSNKDKNLKRNKNSKTNRALEKQVKK